MNLKNKVIILFLLLLLSHCSTLQNYIENRALDFTDIITIGGEVKTVGGSAWIWCFGGGVQFGQEGEGWGARNGYVGYYRTGGYLKWGKLEMGNSFLLMNSQEHIPEAYTTKRSMNKKYTHGNFLFILPANLNGGGRFYRGNNYTKNNFFSPMYYESYPSPFKFPMLCHAPLTVEVSMGLGIGGRIGFNISEFLDFVLGFTTYDFMDDDRPVIKEIE